MATSTTPQPSTADRPENSTTSGDANLSASRSEDGSYVIDPAELHRVYPSAGNDDGTMKQSVPDERTGASLAELLVERDRLVAEQAETIRDLRARLNAEAEERRKLIAILTGPWVPWWRRWFR